MIRIYECLHPSPSLIYGCGSHVSEGCLILRVPCQRQGFQGSLYLNMSGEVTEGHTEAVGTGPDLVELCLGWRGGVWPGRPAHTASVLDWELRGTWLQSLPGALDPPISCSHHKI